MLAMKFVTHLPLTFVFIPEVISHMINIHIV